MTSASVTFPTMSSREKAMRRLRRGDVIFHNVTFVAAIFVLVMLSAVAVSLVIGAWPALKAFGFGFLTNQSWNPVTEKFGGLAAIYGTLVTSFIAMLFA